MPTTFAELGAKEEDIKQMAGHMGIHDNNLLGGYVKLNVEDIEAIYRLAL